MLCHEEKKGRGHEHLRYRPHRDSCGCGGPYSEGLVEEHVLVVPALDVAVFGTWLACVCVCLWVYLGICGYICMFVGVCMYLWVYLVKVLNMWCVYVIVPLCSCLQI